MYLESCLTNLANDSRIDLTLMVTNCGGERSFSKLQMVECTDAHHWAKEADQPDSKEYRLDLQRERLCEINTTSIYKQIRYDKI